VHLSDRLWDSGRSPEHTANTISVSLLAKLHVSSTHRAAVVPRLFQQVCGVRGLRTDHLYKGMGDWIGSLPARLLEFTRAEHNPEFPARDSISVFPGKEYLFNPR
jgi:hypothetical protein